LLAGFFFGLFRKSLHLLTLLCFPRDPSLSYFFRPLNFLPPPQTPFPEALSQTFLDRRSPALHFLLCASSLSIFGEEDYSETNFLDLFSQLPPQ